jgi:hypothetical protein
MARWDESESNGLQHISGELPFETAVAEFLRHHGKEILNLLLRVIGRPSAES